MTITHELFFKKIGRCKRDINNIYWDLIRSNDCNLLWHDLIYKFKTFNTHSILHIVAFLYKIYFTIHKPTSTPLTSTPLTSTPLTSTPTPLTSTPTPLTSTPTPLTTTPIPLTTTPIPLTTTPTKSLTTTPTKSLTTTPTKSLTTNSLTPSVISIDSKQKFTGALRHTPGSNYKEWRKSLSGIKTHNSVNSKLFNEWKKKDNFDPKIYDKTCPWFNYINDNMI